MIWKQCCRQRHIVCDSPSSLFWFDYQANHVIYSTLQAVLASNGWAASRRDRESIESQSSADGGATVRGAECRRSGRIRHLRRAVALHNQLCSSLPAQSTQEAQAPNQVSQQQHAQLRPTPRQGRRRRRWQCATSCNRLCTCHGGGSLPELVSTKKVVFLPVMIC